MSNTLSKPIPKTIETTSTCHKKVTHVLTVGDVEHYCTSAGHVCRVLSGAGIETTPAVVYRMCSRSEKRAHKRAQPLPEGVTITRVPKVSPTPAPAPAPAPAPVLEV